ncbi:putative pseudouridine synthase [Erysiphe necator]|uniref:tRNA pseudouridine(55) synthase n=1 Tax=Uncinula necator TaxID=52586 RepID=A0A0B1PB02_UNCNE|nr:putative pseudouridine synthase [Erysiphe necator]
MSFRLLGKGVVKKMKEGIVEGVFAVNKPSGISSAQVIRDLQKHFNPSKLFAPWIESERISRDQESKSQKRRRREKKIQVKIGHGGTLDPLATGILITGIGRGTKSLHDFLMCKKEYEAIVLFGTSTDTYDRVGKVLKRAPYKHITKEVVEKALENFRGKYMQLPPLFSALKMNGKPLYEYAREGKEIPREIEKRPVEVHELELVEWMEGGTHTHEPPTEEAGYLELNVAKQIWKQTGVKQQNEPFIDKSETIKLDKGVDFKGDGEIEQPENTPVVESDVALKQKKSGDNLIEIGSPKIYSQKRKRSNSESGSPHNEKKDTATIYNKGIEQSDDVPQTPVNFSKINHESSSSCEDNGKPPAARLRMTVTSGFYVRSLCHDLGVAVQSAALMAELKRTRQGDYKIGEDTLEYADLEKGEEIWGPKVERWLSKWQEKHCAPS